MRLIFVDTETTGLTPTSGHRIIEIACVEMVDRKLTGQVFHTFINPERAVPEQAIAIHGITDAMLSDKPRFSEITDQLVDFVSNDMVVMHNAPFDASFFAAEFSRIGSSVPALTQSEMMVDTLPRFRGLYPGQQCSLSALCDRHNLPTPSDENWHSAVTDARMLALLWLAAGMEV